MNRKLYTERVTSYLTPRQKKAFNEKRVKLGYVTETSFIRRCIIEGLKHNYTPTDV